MRIALGPPRDLSKFFLLLIRAIANSHQNHLKTKLLPQNFPDEITQSKNVNNPLNFCFQTDGNNAQRVNAICVKCLGSDLKNSQNLAEPLKACCECKKTYLHSSCAVPTGKISKNLIIQLSSFVESGNKWYCAECKSCARCNQQDRGPCLISCSDCHKNFHISCGSSPIDKKYKSLWR